MSIETQLDVCAREIARASLRLRNAAKAYEEAPEENDDAERWEYDNARAVSDYCLDAYERLVSEAGQSGESQESSSGGAGPDKTLHQSNVYAHEVARLLLKSRAMEERQFVYPTPKEKAIIYMVDEELDNAADDYEHFVSGAE